MKKTKLLINLSFAVVIIALCTYFLFFTKSPAKNTLSQGFSISNDYTSIKLASNEDFSLGDFRLVSYKTEEPEIKKFVSSYINFLDDYVYVKGVKNPTLKNFLSNCDYDISISDPSYKFDAWSHAFEVDMRRLVYVDWWEGAEVKTEKIREMQILSIAENTKIDFLPNPVDEYHVGVIAEVNRIFSKTGERIKDLRIIDFTVIKENGQYKIHDMDLMTDYSQIQAFLGKFNDNSNLTLDILVKDLQNGTVSGGSSSNRINKYAPSTADGPKQFINYDKVKNLDDSIVESIAKTLNEEIVVITNSDSNNKIQSIGAGFFVRPGIIATNCHVIAGANKLNVLNHSGKKIELDGVITANGVLDIALLKTKSEIGTPVKLGDPNTVKREDALIAIGHPLGVTYSISTGVFHETIKNQEVLFLKDKLPLSPGNSGGPLINVNGEVVGINTAINQFGDVSFALPVSYLDSVLKAIDKYKFSDIKTVTLKN